MIHDLKGKPVSTLHKVCISNYTKDKFITTMPRPGWTDNFNLACCFESGQEAMEFTEFEIIKEAIGDERELYIWTDTLKSIFETN